MKNLAFAATAFVLVLAGIELFARVAGTFKGDLDRRQEATAEAWLAYSPNLGWENKPGFEGSLGLADREFDAAGYFTVDSDEVDGSSDKKTVVFVGDSNTFGWGASTPESFVEVTESLLPGVDAINLGVVGYSSYQGRMVLEQYLPVLKPDLVVVSFNFNDRRYVLRPEAIDGPEEFRRVYESSHSAVALIAAALETSHFYRGLRLVLRKAGLVSTEADAVDVTRLEPRVDESAYRRNLSAIVEEAEGMGIPVLFLLLRDDPLLSEHLKKGIASFEEGDFETAIAYLRAAVRSHKMFRDLARVYLVRAYRAQGNEAKAAEVSTTRSLFRSFSGGTVIRLDTDYNEIMRQVAVDNDVALLDGAAVLEAQPSVFVDFCHFGVEGHRRLGEALAGRISDMLGEMPGRP